MGDDSGRFIIHLLYAYRRIAFEINFGCFGQIDLVSFQAIR